MKMAIEKKEEYVQREYYPNAETDLICEYYVDPKKISLKKAAAKIASESGIGSWAEIKTLTKKHFEELAPKVFYISEKDKIIQIAYPSGLFEAGNISQILSNVAGNVLGMSDFKSIKLLDINFPSSFIRKYIGPHYGVDGIRKIMNIHRRPLLSTVVKPRVGLNEKEYALVAHDSWIGGCDFVVDDEALTSLENNDFDKRIKYVFKQKKIVERDTGEKKGYIPNISAPYSEMLRRARVVVKNGGNFAMLNVMTVGFSAIQELRRLDLRIVLYGHKTMHAALTSGTNGISMLVIAKIARLIGFDMFNIGGEVEGKKSSIVIGEEIEQSVVSKDIFQHRLQEDWLDQKPIMAVCSGAIHPAKVRKLIHALGRDIIIQGGGSIHAHPGGTIAGAKAMKQAIDAEMLGLLPQVYAKSHPELDIALKEWDK
jgi:ribulose-bisphosphate carboxylase large chain